TNLNFFLKFQKSGNRHENFKASRGFIIKFKRRERLQEHMLQEDRIKLYIEKMEETEGVNATSRQHTLNMVFDPAVALTNEDPEAV
ncbi:hypothetical protein MKX03_001127, partial [Papaver bracteatum]